MQRVAKCLVFVIFGLFLTLSGHFLSISPIENHQDALARRARESTMSASQAFAYFLPRLARIGDTTGIENYIVGNRANALYIIDSLALSNATFVKAEDLISGRTEIPEGGVLSVTAADLDYRNSPSFLLDWLSGGTYSQRQVADAPEICSIDSGLQLRQKGVILRLNGEFYEILDLRAEDLPEGRLAVHNGTLTHYFSSRLVMKVKDVEGKVYVWVNRKLPTDPLYADEVDIIRILSTYRVFSPRNGPIQGWDGNIWSKAAIGWDDESITVPKDIISQANSWREKTATP
ncbi:MAG: hypothetical protein NTZ48_06450 [Candidatus Omnitrophica bacterium]|nr:hypothetical protein [Candidatus Omnitrophota bacterium]